MIQPKILISVQERLVVDMTDAGGHDVLKI